MRNKAQKWSSPPWLFTFFAAIFFGGLTASRTGSAIISALVILSFVIFTRELWVDLRRRRASSQGVAKMSHLTFLYGFLGMGSLLFVGLRGSSNENMRLMQILVLPLVMLGYWFMFQRLQRSASV